MVLQVRFIYLARKIRTLGIGITVAAMFIYFAGLLVAEDKFREDFEIVNIMSLLILLVSLPVCLQIKKHLKKKVNIENFMTAYFNAHIIPFAILDFFALFCLSTNLLVNGNVIFATIAACATLAGMILLFPKEEDFDELEYPESDGSINSEKDNASANKE